MRPIRSVMVCVLSCILLLALVVATVRWLQIVSDMGEGWAAMGFVVWVSPVMLGFSLLGTGLPIVALYCSGRQRMELFSLVASCVVLVVMSMETIVLLKLPFRGCQDRRGGWWTGPALSLPDSEAAALEFCEGPCVFFFQLIFDGRGAEIGREDLPRVGFHFEVLTE
jgi:hypothetical protein